MKKNNMIKIWYIQNKDGKGGYWSDRFEHFSEEFANMEDGDVFTIKCKALTEKEFDKLEKTSHEFEGW